MSAAAPHDQQIQEAWNALRAAVRDLYAIDRDFVLNYLSGAVNALERVTAEKARLARGAERGCPKQ
jgi:hypothetical protein